MTKQKKPSWNKAPAWAKYRVLMPTGEWYWFELKPERVPVKLLANERQPRGGYYIQIWVDAKEGRRERATAYSRLESVIDKRPE